MKQIILTKGLPGSGKSTWARAFMAEHPNAYKRVNKDELRDMLDCGAWSRDAEIFILAARDLLVVEALKQGKHVIVDDTNFAPKHEARMREIAKQYGATVEVKMFDTPVEECIAQDLKRTRPVGEAVIRKMYNQQGPHQRGVAVHSKPEVAPFDPLLPAIIICDLDGTLAHLNGRSPYDATTCENDVLCEPVAAILQKQGEAVVFMSGREEKYRDQTERWLASHHVHHAGLFMRPTGDKRKDSVIKRELYDAHIRGKYNVLFVLDDRNQVVELWRSLGLMCLQVADGDF
jgi:predicted kinase